MDERNSGLRSLCQKEAARPFESEATEKVQDASAEYDNDATYSSKRFPSLDPYHILSRLSRSGGEDIVNMVRGFDDDYTYKVARLSPDYCFMNEGRAFGDREGAVGFIVAVSKIHWLATHESLPSDFAPYVWSSENIPALRDAFKALLDIQKAVIDAELCWQTQADVTSDIFCTWATSIDEWIEHCSWGGTLNTERLRHVWGNLQQMTPNYVRQASRLPINLSALVMVQGLLAYAANLTTVPRQDLVRRLRSLRNMVENTPRTDCPQRLKAMLAEARELIGSGDICEDSDTFNVRQKRDEKHKLQWLSEWEKREEEDKEVALRLFENHPLLRGAVGIIRQENMDMNHYYAFCEIFNDIDADYGELLRNVFVYGGMKMECGTADENYWHHFLTADAGEMQTVKQRVVEKLLADPVRQLELVSDDFLSKVDSSVDAPDLFQCRTAYYNKFSDGREEYLLSLVHHGL